MTRIIVTNIFCFIVSTIGLAQGVSVELSVRWKKTKSHFNVLERNSDSLLCTPVLKLKYQNLTKQDIYFGNVVNSKSKYPNVIKAAMINTQMSIVDRVIEHTNYKGQSFKVKIGKFWEVINQFEDSLIEKEVNIVNDELYDIYEVLRTQHYMNNLNIARQLSCFDFPNKENINYKDAQKLIAEKVIQGKDFRDIENSFLSEDEIINSYSDKFIFLKRGETYEQEISLIGFYLLGGSYEFMLTDTLLSRNLFGRDQQVISIPKKANGYRLYDGTILTNTVTLKFK